MDLWVMNIHTDAYGKDGTKGRQLDIFHEELIRLRDEGALVIAGGDFNAIPPGSDQVRDFPDSICEEEEFHSDDYGSEAEWLNALYADFNPAIPLADYQRDNSLYFTHSVDGRGFWNRKLDYLFTNATWASGSGQTLQSVENGGIETMPFSDHAPLVASLEIP
jgi:endonuclease/exonuclease/phosphatase family metal-dependent hydrolase